jgi:hypothetical protein
VVAQPESVTAAMAEVRELMAKARRGGRDDVSQS